MSIVQKYQGPLVSLPIVEEDGKPLPGNFVQLSSLTPKYGTVNTTLSSGSILPALVDTGTTNVQIPPTIADSIYKYAGAVPSGDGNGLVPCNLGTANANLTFGFGGDNGIKNVVPLRELVLSYTGQAHFRDGSPACELSVQALSPGGKILGDTFLRSAYIMYNMEANKIGLAQSAPDKNAGTDIVEDPV